MKMKTLSLLAGVSAPLIMTTAASAGFVGVEVEVKDNPFGLHVVNVYAVFDRPGEDLMVAVAGTPDQPLLVQVNGGVFYNHQFGNDQAPSEGLINGPFPSMAFDTFVTIGKKNSTGDTTLISPGFPVGITGSVFATDASGWVVTPGAPQANPFDAANSFPGDGRILIAQFSTLAGDGVFIHGTMLLQFTSNGVAGQQFFGGWTSIPAPGALALLGAAGMVGLRRRRRR